MKKTNAVNHQIQMFELSIGNEFYLILPRGAKHLTIEVHAGVPYSFFEVDVDKKDDTVLRNFCMMANGEEFDSRVWNKYHGTFRLGNRGEYIFHMYEFAFKDGK